MTTRNCLFYLAIFLSTAGGYRVGSAETVSESLTVTQGNVLRGTALSSNRYAVGLESNLLFNATNRFAVTYTGPSFNYELLFDGKFDAIYSSSGVSDSNPAVLLIEDLPYYHTQVGAWFGWSTRWWPIKRYKVEGYQNYPVGTGHWATIIDHSTQQLASAQYDELVFVPPSVYEKLRLTIYESNESSGLFGLSEIFFLHPEAARSYQGLLPSKLWEGKNGNVGIGLKNPQNALEVNGTIRAKEVIVETANFPDYVFEEGYELRTLREVEAHIAEHGRLPGVPSAAEVATTGVSVGDSQRLLLEKIEELTLYAIEKEKQVAGLEEKLSERDQLVSQLQQGFEDLRRRLAQIETSMGSGVGH